MNAACTGAIDALRAVGGGQATWRDAAQAIGRALGADAAGILVYRASSHELESEEGVGFDNPAMREYGAYYQRYDVLLQRFPRRVSGRSAISAFQMPSGRVTRSSATFCIAIGFARFLR